MKKSGYEFEKIQGGIYVRVSLEGEKEGKREMI